MGQDLGVGEAVLGQAEGPVLAHADAVAFAGPFDHQLPGAGSRSRDTKAEDRRHEGQRGAYGTVIRWARGRPQCFSRAAHPFAEAPSHRP